MGERSLHVAVREIDPQSKQRTSRGYRWLVESRMNGIRTRKYFKQGKKSEAIRYRDELFRQADEVRKQDRHLINGDFLHEAITAQRVLSPLGKTITDAVAFYSEHLITSNKQSQVPLNDAIGRFLDAKEAKGIKRDTIKRYRETLNRFQKAFEDRALAGINGEEIERWWQSFGSIANQRANRTDVNVFFNWVVKSTRYSHITTNPVPAPPEISRRVQLTKRPPHLSANQVERLLNTCGPELAPIIIAQVFLGVRPEESLRLHWEHFDFKARELTIPPEIAKGGEKHARINQIPKNAMAWLIPYSSLTHGKILKGVYSKSAFDKRMRAARTSAGWPPGTWPQNALRKTFISCHFACYSNAPLTAAIAGTSESVIFSNYRSMIKKTEALKLWEIYPQGNEILIEKASNALPAI